jgi:hypothetical protein
MLALDSSVIPIAADFTKLLQILLRLRNGRDNSSIFIAEIACRLSADPAW